MSYLEQCIEVGIRGGLDVSWFVKEDWDYDQLWEIRDGLEDGIDVSEYAKKELGWRSMHKTRANLLYKKPRVIDT